MPIPESTPWRRQHLDSFTFNMSHYLKFLKICPVVLGVETGREVWGRRWIRIGFAKEQCFQFEVKESCNIIVVTSLHFEWDVGLWLKDRLIAYFMKALCISSLIRYFFIKLFIYLLIVCLCFYTIFPFHLSRRLFSTGVSVVSDGELFRDRLVVVGEDEVESFGVGGWLAVDIDRWLILSGAVRVTIRPVIRAFHKWPKSKVRWTMLSWGKE